MRKGEIIKNVSEKSGIPKVDVIVALESFFKEVKMALVKGDPVHVRGFGTFLLKKQRAKTGRDIQNKTAVPIPERLIPSFRPSKEFIDPIKKKEIHIGG